VYSLSDEHDEWSDTEDLVPEEPRVPAALRPLFPDGETVGEVGGLTIYAHGGAPYFGSTQAVEATPQEMDAWRTQWAQVEKAQQVFRTRMEWAQAAYEAAAKQALADLAEAMEPWKAAEADLKERSLALAAKLHEHRTAAEEWEKEREVKRQAHLDTIHGPRVLVLYKPVQLSSANQADHIARVHLVTCGRRAKRSEDVWGNKHNDEGLRANDAWARLTHPKDWISNGFGGSNDKNLRVKFCAFCKPWTVFQEHLDQELFPRPLYDRGAFYLGSIRLTELPEAWADSMKEK
jgi:hypothetical protein